jgi:hypothetical protein
MRIYSRVVSVALLLLLVGSLVTACDVVGALPTRIPTYTPSPAPLHTPIATSTSAPAATATSTLVEPDPATPTAGATATADATPTSGPPALTGVLLIAIDGLRPDALQLADTPNLDRLIETGAVSWAAQTVLPSVTLPGTTSMLAGSSPEVHGVRWNVYDLERGYVPLPTVFSVAHDAGLSTAMIVGKAKLEHIAVPGTVDTYGYVIGSDADIAGFAAENLRQVPIDVMFVHLPGVDSAGHAHSWLSEPQLEAVTRADAAVEILLSALEELGKLENTLIILTADHGGFGVSHGGSEPESMTIPWIIVGPGVRQGYEIEGDVKVYDTAATAAWALGLPLPAEW